MSGAHMGTRVCLLALCGAVLLALSGCGNKTTAVRFKVNSEPEGAYVLYQMSGPDVPCAGEWIYFGNTPLQGIHQFTSKQLKGSDRISLKVMQPGYMDQKKDWAGVAFYDEAMKNGVIYWTPEMIPTVGP
ncbi:MAG: hypothetical protein RBT36_10895 [Desulfobulbus sp.]|jgi:hypothetical protein|nr:hypothetical protein [Desulfobulbus sp.]